MLATRDEAAEICAKLLPHTTSQHNVALIEGALAKAYERAIEDCRSVVGDVLNSPDGAHKNIGTIIQRIRALIPQK